MVPTRASPRLKTFDGTCQTHDEENTDGSSRRQPSRFFLFFFLAVFGLPV